MSGDFEFGWSNTTTLIVARSKGLPLRILSRGIRGGSRPAESSADMYRSLETSTGDLLPGSDTRGDAIVAERINVEPIP